MNPIPVNLAVEDALSEAVVRSLLLQSGQTFAVGAVYGGRGFGDLKRMTSGFNQAARGTPFILLTDLDRAECPPSMMQDWLKPSKHPNFIFRVAVREVESWLMAHRKAFARFIGVAEKEVPEYPDTLGDPKNELLRLVGRSRHSELRRDILPPSNSLRSQGPGYNLRLGEYVKTVWNVDEASQCSPSLFRAFECIKQFSPTWESGS
jgi:hypothetical protein